MFFSEIAWKKENTDEGFTIPWGKIVVTAISQDPQRCIYFMIDSKLFDEPASDSNGTNGDNHENNEDDDDDDEGVDAESENEMTEFWLIPENGNDVDNIYFFMSKYPSADENMDDSEEEDEEFFDGEDMEQMNINDNDENDPRFADN